MECLAVSKLPNADNFVWEIKIDALASLGNELIARSVADHVEGSLQDRPKLSKPHADKHALGDHR
jgi:hypothetical protein